MGNNQPCPVIQLVLNHSSVNAGDPVSGTANFRLPQTFTDLLVVFHLKGLEKNSFQVQSQNIHGRVLILNHQQVLFACQGGKIIAGNYSVPFKILTPKGIPGTFSLHSSKSSASIKYRVLGKLVANQQVVAVHKLVLVIKQAIDTARISIIGSAESLVKCCSCFSKGICRMSAHLDKNAYLPEERVTVNIDFDQSKTSGQVSRVRVRLVRVLSLTSQGGYSEVFRAVLADKKAKVRTRPGLLRENSLELSLKISEKKHDLALTATTDGRLIRCRYHVEVSAFLGAFHNNGPVIDIPVLIFPNEIFQEQPSAPEDWSPVELPECVESSNEPYSP